MEIIIPHNKVSRLVTEADMQKVFEASEEIMPLLNKPAGLHRRYFAIAHAQVEKDDPLRFFVLNSMTIEFGSWPFNVIINPVIIRHTEHTVNSIEGCASFPLLPAITVQRWNKIEVEFSTMMIKGDTKEPVLSKRMTRPCRSNVAKIFQHEIDHLDGKYIYEQT